MCWVWSGDHLEINWGWFGHHPDMFSICCFKTYVLFFSFVWNKLKHRPKDPISHLLPRDTPARGVLGAAAPGKTRCERKTRWLSGSCWSEGLEPQFNHWFQILFGSLRRKGVSLWGVSLWGVSPFLPAFFIENHEKSIFQVLGMISSFLIRKILFCLLLNISVGGLEPYFKSCLDCCSFFVFSTMIKSVQSIFERVSMMLTCV